MSFAIYSLARVCSRTVFCRYNCTSSYCVSRGIHTSSDPGLHVNIPHPSALILRCLSVSNNPTYSVLVQRFDPHQKRHRESFGETPYLPDFHSNGTQRVGNGPLRQVKLSAKNHTTSIRTHPVLSLLFEMRTTQPPWEASPIRTNPIHDGDSK